MGVELKKTLEKLLIPNNGEWGLMSVESDDQDEEVIVRLEYLRKTVEVSGKEYPIYDYRPERSWRHLDLWQYKTLIVCRLPRYDDGSGVKTVEVPWADSHERMSWMLEKKR
jgi:hypothetical protein